MEAREKAPVRAAPASPGTDAGGILEFFRADMGPEASRILVPATLLVTFGAPMVLIGTSARHLALIFPGVCMMMTGLLLGFLGMARLLKHDRYVAVSADLLVLALEDPPELRLPWGDLARIRSDGRALVVEPRDAAPLRFEKRFSVASAAHIAGRLEEFRRKASFDLV